LVVVGTLVAIGAVLRLARIEPDLARLSLAVTLVLAVVWVAVDVLEAPQATWTVTGRRPVRPPGVDPVLASYLRVLEHHEDARTPTPAVRDRLAHIAEERLERRYGLELSHPAARDLLGPELTDALTGPVRRFRRRELASYLDRLEQL
jgi:hypothetical protein